MPMLNSLGIDIGVITNVVSIIISLVINTTNVIAIPSSSNVNITSSKGYGCSRITFSTSTSSRSERLTARSILILSCRAAA